MTARSVALNILQNRTGRVPHPSWCTYLVSYRCNARCGMCDSWRMKPGAELSVDEVRAVFGKIGPLDVIRLSGGEPFLRPDFAELARVISEQSRPTVLHVSTNGSFTDRVIDFIEHFPDRSKLQMMVSFDGLEAEHDRSRGAEVTFAQAEATARAIAARGIPVTANHTVISPRSMADHRGLCARLEPHGVEVTSVIAYAESSMYAIKLRGKKADHLIVPTGYPVHPALAGADVIGFVKEELARVPAMKRLEVRVGKRYYLRGLLSRLEGEPTPKLKPPCVATRSHIRLLPDGRVPVCQFNTEVIGDLRTQSFDEVWQSAAARSARAWVDACPGCWAECEVLPSAIYTGDILRAVV